MMPSAGIDTKFVFDTHTTTVTASAPDTTTLRSPDPRPSLFSPTSWLPQTLLTQITTDIQAARVSTGTANDDSDGVRARALDAQYKLDSTALVQCIACNLHRTVITDKTTMVPQRLELRTSFHSATEPAIRLPDMLKSLVTKFNISNEVVLHTYITISAIADGHAKHPIALAHCRKTGDRIEHFTQFPIYPTVNVDRQMLYEHPMEVTRFTIHRLLITGLLVFSKYLNDVHYNNASFAKHASVTLQNLNEMEIDFLTLLQFTLNIDIDVYIRSWTELHTSHNHCTEHIGLGPYMYGSESGILTLK